MLNPPSSTALHLRRVDRLFIIHEGSGFDSAQKVADASDIQGVGNVLLENVATRQVDGVSKEVKNILTGATGFSGVGVDMSIASTISTPEFAQAVAVA